MRSNSAYFISIIIVQWADLMICKTRIRSLFEQGMTNTFMNYSLFFETLLGAFLVYTNRARPCDRIADVLLSSLWMDDVSSTGCGRVCSDYDPGDVGSLV